MKSIKLLLLAILLSTGNYIAAQSSPLSFTINAGGSLSDMRIKGILPIPNMDSVEV
jgi:hypothetical protein